MLWVLTLARVSVRYWLECCTMTRNTWVQISAQSWSSLDDLQLVTEAWSKWYTNHVPGGDVMSGKSTYHKCWSLQMLICIAWCKVVFLKIPRNSRGSIFHKSLLAFIQNIVEVLVFSRRINRHRWLDNVCSLGQFGIRDHRWKIPKAFLRSLVLTFSLPQAKQTLWDSWGLFQGWQANTVAWQPEGHRW